MAGRSPIRKRRDTDDIESDRYLLHTKGLEVDPGELNELSALASFDDVDGGAIIRSRADLDLNNEKNVAILSGEIDLTEPAASPPLAFGGQPLLGERGKT